MHQIMWNDVGINRSEIQLQQALKKLKKLYKELYKIYKKTPISKTTIDFLHGCQASYAVAHHAYLNKKKYWLPSWI